MKKFFTVLMALVLVLSMGTVALAADGTTATTGTITITNALKGETYHAYRIFDLESFSGTSYSYKLSAKWADFKADDYFTVNDAGYVEWHKSLVDNADDVKAFAELAKAYLDKVSYDAEVKATSDGAVTMSGLDLGYYLVDTSLGSICSLTTTDTTAEITDKNSVPSVKKEVQEDKDNSWGEKNDADIGQKVDFRATITAGKSTKNYVLHDTMSDGLTFIPGSVKVEGFEEGTDYEVITNCACKCTFAVDFTTDFEGKVTEGQEIVVTYSATLNENAIIAKPGNPNEVYLSYGDAQETAKDETITYTWKMDVFKFAKIDGVVTSLANAKFQLLDKDGNVIKFTEVTEVNGVAVTVPTYKVDAAGTVEEITTDADGKFELVGLDEGSYKLKETAAPAGYNELKNPIDVTITSDLAAATWTVAPAEDGLTVEVENKTGSLLPETGGIGTTIFYVVGLALMLGAAILLISKKRMTAKAE